MGQRAGFSPGAKADKARAMIRFCLILCAALGGCARYQEISAALPPPVEAAEVALQPTDPIMAAALAQAAEAESLAEEIATLERIAADLRRRAEQDEPNVAAGLQARADALRARADALRNQTL